MPAYLYNAPSGVEGSITRPDETNVEPAMLIAVSTVYAQKFGIPMKYTTGGIQQFNGGAETAATFAGVLVREVPSQSGNINSGFSDNVPNPEQVQGLAVRGYVSVKCPVGTPVRGSAPYIRIVADTGKLVGDFEATSDGGNSILMTNASWASDGKDADNNAELRFNIAK